ncbi:MAG: hypothetical protein MUC97_12800 [Bernardetiaceae bacterium]|jgi:hypothetical protein|nr:hypothetical protein [Bernardetiaceae bacterium]
MTKYLIISALLLLGCASADSADTQTETRSTPVPEPGKQMKELLQAYGKQLPDTGKWAYIIVMEGGCGSCAVVTQKFVKENLDTLTGLVAIASIRSSKSTNLIFGGETRQRPNFLRDSLEYAFASGLVEGRHPKMILVEKGKVVVAKDIIYSTAIEQFKEVKQFLLN